MPGGRGLPHKEDGVLVGPFRGGGGWGKKALLVRFRIFSLKKSTARALALLFRFQVLSRKKYDKRQFVVLEVVALRGENNFRPRRQNSILVHLRGFLQNFQRAPLYFLYGSPLPLSPNDNYDTIWYDIFYLYTVFPSVLTVRLWI